MAYQARDKDNNPRTPGNFTARLSNNAAKNPQPAYNEATDSYNNTYRDYNGDFVPHNIRNEPKFGNPGFSIESALSGTPQEGETLTGTVATATGGIGPYIYSARWQTSSDGSAWNTIFAEDSSAGANVQVLLEAEHVGLYVRFSTRVRDNGGNNPFATGYSTTAQIGPVTAAP